MTPEETTDRLALRALVEAYAWAADARDHDAYAATFTPDGTMAGFAPDATEPFVSLSGHDAIGAALHANDGFARTFHAIENHYVTIDGDTASGWTYCLARHLAGADVVITPLRYRDSYVRTPDGWRFSAREIHFTWVEKAIADPAALATWTGQDTPT
jgi:hypothetical protein